MKNVLLQRPRQRAYRSVLHPIATASSETPPYSTCFDATILPSSFK